MKVKCTVEELNIYGVTHAYNERMWIEDKNHPEGGSIQYVEKLYPTPMIEINFVGTVDTELTVGGVYVCGVNSFAAIGKNKIQNMYKYVRQFNIPKELTLISTPFIEKSN